MIDKVSGSYFEPLEFVLMDENFQMVSDFEGQRCIV